MDPQELKDNLKVLQAGATLYINKFAAQANSPQSERFKMLIEIIEQRMDSDSETDRDLAELADLGVIVVLTHLANAPKENG